MTWALLFVGGFDRITQVGMVSYVNLFGSAFSPFTANLYWAPLKSDLYWDTF